MAPQHPLRPNNGKTIEQMGNLNGYRTVTTWLYNCRGVPTALYAYIGQWKWVVVLRHDYSTSITPQWLHKTPCGQMAKNWNDGQLEWLSHSTTWLYNCRGVPSALFAYKGQCNWVVFPRQDCSTSMTPQWLHNTSCRQMAKNWNDRQLEWLSHSNHMTIQLQMFFQCFICFQRAMQMTGWSKAGLLYKHHTPMAPQHPLWPNYQKLNRRWATWMAIAR